MEQHDPIKVDKYIFIRSTESTNQYAQELSSKSTPFGINCIYTAHQTQGRGQIGRNWYSGIDSNLAISYLVPCRLDINKHFDISRALSLAVHDLCVSLIVDDHIRIKWPNDIYFKDNKIAGLLIQNNVRGQVISSTIMGLGLNVNQDEFPSELPNPISLYNITGKTYSLPAMVWLYNDLFLKRLGQLLSGMASFEQEYEKNLYKKDSEVEFTEVKTGHQCSGLIRGVNPDGRIRIEVDDTERSYGFHDIRFRIGELRKY